jgi:hypothetical protein
LRRDLIASLRAGGPSPFRLAFGLASAAAGAFAVLLILFVLDPAVPARIHASFLGQSGAGMEIGSATARGTTDFQDVALDYILEQRGASSQKDQMFLESWFGQQDRPVQVKSMEDERFLAIRQFKLTSGERVIVLTELGKEEPTRTASSVAVAAQTF